MDEPRIVYVIDDEEAVRDSVAFLLEAHDLHVQSFSSGDEFLAAAPSLAPGCVLTDMRMPGMDGLDLLRHIKERDLCWPVLVMTGHGEIPLAVRALKAGASDFIEKPLRGEALIDAILSALQTIQDTHERTADIAEINARIALLTTSRARSIGAARGGQSEQGDRLQSRNEPAHGRGTPRSRHAQDAGPQPFRIGADGRKRGRAPGWQHWLIFPVPAVLSGSITKPR